MSSHLSAIVQLWLPKTTSIQPPSTAHPYTNSACLSRPWQPLISNHNLSHPSYTAWSHPPIRPLCLPFPMPTSQIPISFLLLSAFFLLFPDPMNPYYPSSSSYIFSLKLSLPTSHGSNKSSYSHQPISVSIVATLSYVGVPLHVSLSSSRSLGSLGQVCNPVWDYSV